MLEEEKPFVTDVDGGSTATTTTINAITKPKAKDEEKDEEVVGERGGKNTGFVTEIKTSKGIVKLPGVFDACKAGIVPVVRYYLDNDKSLDIDAVDEEGGTLLHWAAYKGYHEMMVYLIRAGANVNALSSSGKQTPLHWAVVTGDLKAIHILACTGADLAAADEQGYNIMHLAAIYNRVYVAYYAFNKGLSLNSRDVNGHTPMHWAVYKKSLDVMRLLHRLGADVNVPDSYGRTPLHWAASGCDKKIVRTLISWGAKPNLKDDGGNTPDVIAQEKKDRKSALLIKAARETPLNKKALSAYGTYWTIGMVVGYATVSVMIAYLPILLNALLFTFAYFFIRRKYSMTFPYNIVNCKFWSAFFSMTWLVGSIYMNMKLIPALSSRFLLSGIAVVLDIATIVVYVRLARANPGVIDPQPLLQEDLEKAIMTNGYLGDFCPTCLMMRPARSKHCETCNHCVARFDHHCVWIDGCVGYLNNGRFMIYLATLISLQVMFLVLLVLYFAKIAGEHNIAELSIFGFANLIWNDSSLGVALGCLFFIQIAWEGNLLFQQCQNVVNNTSINERMNWRKYPFMKDPKTGRRINPFKLPTAKENIKEFVKGGRNWFTFRWVDLVPQGAAPAVSGESGSAQAQQQEV